MLLQIAEFIDTHIKNVNTSHIIYKLNYEFYF